MIREYTGDHLNETQADRVKVVKEDFLEEVTQSEFWRVSRSFTIVYPFIYIHPASS